MNGDPDLWKEVAGWLGGLLILPLGYVWKKVNSSVQKDDFREFVERFDKHCDQDRETQSKLFDKCDEIKTLLIERLK